MTDAHGHSEVPSPFEMLESVLPFITGAVVAAALVTRAGAILAIPYLLVRSIRNIRSHRAARAPESAAAVTARSRAVAASRPLA